MSWPNEEVTTSATHWYRSRRAPVQGLVVVLACALEEVVLGLVVVVAIQVIVRLRLVLVLFQLPLQAPPPPPPRASPPTPSSPSVTHFTRRSSSRWTMAGAVLVAFEDANRQPTMLLLLLVVAAAVGGGGGTGT